jgi:hypothetical protein
MIVPDPNPANNGGGILNLGTLTITSSTVDSNTSESNAGGIQSGGPGLQRGNDNHGQYDKQQLGRR